MWVQNSTSKLAFISGMGSQPSTAPTHHTQSASVLSKTSTPTVVSAEPLCSYAQMTSAKLGHSAAEHGKRLRRPQAQKRASCRARGFIPKLRGKFECIKLFLKFLK